MGSARFTMDKRGVGQLLKSAAMEAAMLQRAERIAARARQIAPVGHGSGDRHPGEYRDSITTSSTKDGGRRKDRAAATATAEAPHSRYVEYAPDKDGVAHHTMLRAAVETGER
jgi:hypothetical protein